MWISYLPPAKTVSVLRDAFPAGFATQKQAFTVPPSTRRAAPLVAEDSGLAR